VTTIAGVDLTPQLVNDVDFRTRRGGGYDADEVDDFLERVAVGVGELHDRIRQAQERAAAAEARAREAEAKLAAVPPPDAKPAEPEIDETLRRTLVLAQRTADAAVREAEEHAARVVSEAEQRSTELLTEAEAEAQRITVEAEAEARRGADETRQRLVDEIIALEATRDLVKSDVSLLERHVDDQRSRVRAVATDLHRFVDDPAGLRLEPLPPLSGASTLLDSPAEAATDVEPEPEPAATADAVDDDDAPAADGDGSPARAVPAVDDELDSADDVWTLDDPASPIDVRDAVVSTTTPTASAAAGVSDAWARPAGGALDTAPADDVRADGPLGLFDGVSADPAEAMTAERASIWDTPTSDDLADADDDDAYLNELRKAMIDEHDSQGAAADDRPQRSRFGRRR
jgi:DivIVA domain-containing protein